MRIIPALAAWVLSALPLAAVDVTYVDVAPGNLAAPVMATLQRYVGGSVFDHSNMPIAPLLAALQPPVALMNLPRVNRVTEADGSVVFVTGIFADGTFNSIHVAADGTLLDVIYLHC